ncbi:MAG: EF-Tu/IF-2/RF-3 family GTPase, partial [Oscillospiraceae bacterium]
GREGTASYSPHQAGTDLVPLFDTIINYIKPPEGDEKGETQVLVSSIDYNEYVGRVSIGRIGRGNLSVNQDIILCDYHDKAFSKKARITSIFEFEGVKRVPVETATVGDVVAFSGIEDVSIGNTVCSPLAVEAIPFVKISEPTVEMTFSVNDSPFAGQEGKFVTSRQLSDRLFRELLKDVSLIVTRTVNTDSFRVLGRGEMHLSILIETMRREGYEFQVSTPHVLFKDIDGQRCEPFERFVADVPPECVGSVMEKLGSRKGELVTMTPQG